MTENIPQTSASDRLDAARKALADLRIMIAMERDSPSDRSGAQLARLIRISDALIAATPPSVGESAEQIADRLTDDVMTYAQAEGLTERGIAMAGIRYGFNAGIRHAHERWEPADRPSQEQMLRWLGIEYEDTDGTLYIEPQNIDKEES